MSSQHLHASGVILPREKLRHGALATRDEIQGYDAETCFGTINR